MARFERELSNQTVPVRRGQLYSILVEVYNHYIDPKNAFKELTGEPTAVELDKLLEVPDGSES